MLLILLLHRCFLVPLLALWLAQGVTQRTQIDEFELGKVIRPIVAVGLESAENHAVDRRQIRPPGQPDRAHVKIDVIIPSTTDLAVDTVRNKTTGTAKGPNIHDKSIWPKLVQHVLTRESLRKQVRKGSLAFGIGVAMQCVIVHTTPWVVFTREIPDSTGCRV